MALPEVEAKIKPVLDEFRKLMLAQGYSEGAVDMAIKRALESAKGKAMEVDRERPELVEADFIQRLPEELSYSENYLARIYTLLTPTPRTIKVYGMKYWEEKIKKVLG